MSTTAPATATARPPELLERIAPLLGRTLADALKPILQAHERRLAELETETISLRRAVSTLSGAGVRRHFSGLMQADPDNPGCSLVFLDDGSALSVPDARLNALAGVEPVGRA